jgi:hypothetical protein
MQLYMKFVLLSASHTQKSKRAFFLGGRALQAFLADESKSTDDDDDDSGSTVDPALYKQFAFTELEGRKSYVIRALTTPYSLGYAPFGAHHLSVRHCISECEWHHYSIFLLQGPEIHDPVRSHYTVLHLITSNYSILAKLTNMYVHLLR